MFLDRVFVSSRTPGVPMSAVATKTSYVPGREPGWKLVRAQASQNMRASLPFHQQRWESAADHFQDVEK